MLETKLRILKELFNESIESIDTGNSNKTEEELDDIIEIMSTLNRGISRRSKRYVCEKILHCSASTFDNYLTLGIIPPGKKEYGFKELSWKDKDFDDAVLYRINKYKNKKGL